MPKIAKTTDGNIFSPKKRTPWDALETFANDIATKTSTGLTNVKHVNLQDISGQNGIQNGIQRQRS